MRIVSGTLKGRRINPPVNLKARPTTDIAKEGLFNILTNEVDFEEISVLDMFGGTGGISYEFASRGCTGITLIEMNQLNFSFIKKTIKELELDSVIDAIKGDSFKFVESKAGKYDLIFADPPYSHPRLAEIPNLVFEKDLLKEGGMLILEHPKEFEFSDNEFFYRHRNYGHVNFTFFRK